MRVRVLITGLMLAANGFRLPVKAQVSTSPAPAPAGATAVTSSDPSVATGAPLPELADQVLTYREIEQLDLTPGQVRQVIELLSTFKHLEQNFQAQERAAVEPISPQVRRVAAALAAGTAVNGPDQTAVSAALAPLETMDANIQKRRRETVSGLRTALTPAQIEKIRAWAGAAAPPVGNAPPPGQIQAGAAPEDQMQTIERQREAAQQETAAFIDQRQKQMKGIQEELGKLDQEEQDTQNNPQQDAAAADQANNPAAGIQQELARVTRQAAIANQRAALVEQASRLQMEMTRQVATMAQRQVGYVQKMALIQTATMRAANGANAAAGDGVQASGADTGLETLAVERLFLQPGVLTFLTARAVQ